MPKPHPNTIYRRIKAGWEPAQAANTPTNWTRRRIAVGEQFGRLTVVERADGYRWRCSCTCGNETTTDAEKLLTGHTKSCGCVRRELFATMRTTHGHARRGTLTPEYRCWRALFDRCDRPSNKSYANYGGRGIKVCDRWSESFENFYSDMGPKPSPQHSIDRIDNDGPYAPDNCRWATPREQAANRGRH